MLRGKLLRFGTRIMGWPLAPLSWLYAAVIFWRNRLYDWKWLPVTRVRPVVVSVGNIVAGGTGKTPLVHLLARQFPHRKVAILSRGYGEFPDEAVLLAKRLPEVRVCIGKDRSQLAQGIAVDLLILDDGFQHRKLHRDFDIVLITDRKEHYLPWGFLRDSPKRLSQAEGFQSRDFAIRVTQIRDAQGRQVPSIRGWKVAIFCGIAHPERFKKTVEGLGAIVIAQKFFGDHELADFAQLPKADAYLCTEKDFVKLPPTSLPLYYLEIELEPLQCRERWEKLIEKIDQTIDDVSTYERSDKNSFTQVGREHCQCHCGAVVQKGGRSGRSR